MFIPVGDARIYATSFGPTTAPVIVGIGGWIGSWELWVEPFSILSRTWRTIAYDHRGTGATVAATDSITHQQLVDDVFCVLDAYEVERCVLAAESAGAFTALGAALADSQRIIGLVLVDGLCYRAPSPETDAFLAGLREDYEQTLDRFVQLCVPEPDSDENKRWGRQIIGRASQDSAIALYQMPSTTDLRNDLPRITQPTLVLHGEADAIVTTNQARILAKALPHSKLVILPGAGHVPTATRPIQVAHEISSFFGI
jgi:pimeloyl-ACP methyl ester carboxylesterase